MTDVAVVVTTYERPEACGRAVRSALAQTPAPVEVLISDDGSRPATVRRLAELAAGDDRVRLLTATDNTGTPAHGRNRGALETTAQWVAFLDDDDAWLPGKLERQVERLARADVDVIATNALRSDGRAYFPNAPAEWRPERRDLIRDNPIVVSSALVRRETILAAGGFIPARWARGVADYAMWLTLADMGAEFCVLGEPLVRYEDADAARMSTGALQQEAAVARLLWSRWARRPTDRPVLRSAASRSAAVLRLASRRARGGP